jgi:hypothetical protein
LSFSISFILLPLLLLLLLLLLLRLLLLFHGCNNHTNTSRRVACRQGAVGLGRTRLLLFFSPRFSSSIFISIYLCWSEVK